MENNKPINSYILYIYISNKNPLTWPNMIGGQEQTLKVQFDPHPYHIYQFGG